MCTLDECIDACARRQHMEYRFTDDKRYIIDHNIVSYHTVSTQEAS